MKLVRGDVRRERAPAAERVRIASAAAMAGLLLPELWRDADASVQLSTAPLALCYTGGATGAGHFTACVSVDGRPLALPLAPSAPSGCAKSKEAIVASAGNAGGDGSHGGPMVGRGWESPLVSRAVDEAAAGGGGEGEGGGG